MEGRSELRVAVLASGAGSNLEAIVEAGIPVAVVVVDRSCGALQVAARAGIPSESVERESYGPNFDRVAYTERLVEVLRRHRTDLVVMAGFGTVLAAPMYGAYPGRVLNTHPALLPDFKGWHAVADALAAGVPVTGCTVHVATEEVDAGPILAQEKVPVEPGDTEDSLHERIKTVERRLYPETILRFMDRIRADGELLASGGAATAREGSSEMIVKRALLSVWDKEGLVEFAQALVSLGIEIISSGGTASALAKAGVEHLTVEEVTGAPEMLSGRVKTLHPSIHGGILADRSKSEHLADLGARGIRPIDLVVCNLYPFRSDPSVELIDIGGPAMVRAAAKNHEHVGVVVDPGDYPMIVEALRSEGGLSLETRRRLARKAFAHSASYDTAIVSWLDGLAGAGSLPPTIHLTLERAQDLRYGENPHQTGARYRDGEVPTWWDSVEQLSGMELSYLNLFDAEAAWRLVHEVGRIAGGASAVVIVKHANPCGVAVAGDLAEAYSRALDCDPVSAFGGIVALGGHVTEAVAEVMANAAQSDVVVAPSYDDAAVVRLIAKRKNTRILRAAPPSEISLDLRRLDTGFLAQVPDEVGIDPSKWRVVTKRQADESLMRDAALAWLVCARTTSNAIVVARSGSAVGIGAGQQNRLDAARIAVEKAGSHVRGSAAASDAFFPFRDGLDALASAGVALVIQPGGSVRDDEVIAAADEHGICMVLTGERHFRH